MNYSELTDDQINERVGHTEHDGICTPDYCNDWAAIGQIIEDNKIDLNYCKKIGTWDAINSDHGYTTDVCYLEEHKNPKRAAAICFLMMSEVKG